jgi:phage tail-like protein
MGLVRRILNCDGKYVAGMNKLTVGLTRTTEVVRHRQGGDPSTSRKSPGRTKYETVTLEQGITHDTEFQSWPTRYGILEEDSGRRYR